MTGHYAHAILFARRAHTIRQQAAIAAAEGNIPAADRLLTLGYELRQVARGELPCGPCNGRQLRSDT